MIRGEMLAACKTRLALLLERDGVDEDAPERARDVRAKRRQATQLVGQREHVLAQRDGGQDAIDVVCGAVCHAPPGAARAHASALARERDQEIALAVVAVKPDESVGEDAALQIGAERLLDVPGQAAVIGLAGVCEEGLEVARDDAVEHGLGRAARGVFERSGARALPRGDAVRGCGSRGHGPSGMAHHQG
jgi:hypothetical protein